MAPVEGKVTLNGHPMASGQVFLWPEDADSKARPVATVVNGAYKVTTDGNPGAPLGKYKVTASISGPAGGETDPSKIEPGKVPLPPALPVRFGSVKDTPLQIEVRENAPAGSYDLNIKK